MRVKVSKSYLEVSRSILHLFSKKKRSMNRLSDFDRNGVIFGFLAMTAIFGHCAIEAFVNFQIMSLRNLPDPQKREVVSGKSLADKINFLCDSLGIQRIKIVDPQLWDDFTKTTKFVRNFFIHPKPWEFPQNLQMILQQVPLGRYSLVGSDIIGHFFAQRRVTRPTYLNRNEVFFFPNFKVVP